MRPIEALTGSTLIRPSPRPATDPTLTVDTTMSPAKDQPPRGRSRSFFWAGVALIVAIAYRVYLHDVVSFLFGFNRVVQPIEDFPWDCKRLHHPLLEGCEDIWLDDDARRLYGACANLETRQGWTPGNNKFNLSARSTPDHIVVLSIDEPGPDGLYGARRLKIDYPEHLDLLGFDVRLVGDRRRFWLLNHRPPVDPATGKSLDANKVGANSTIEVFDLNPVSDVLDHVKTIVSDALVSPNNLAVDQDGIGFLISNDHDSKVSTFRDLGMIFGGGSVSYCRTDTGKCKIVASKGFQFANGVALGHDGLFYVAHSSAGIVSVHRMVDDKLVEVDRVHLGIPIDNLRTDKQGNIIAAAIPDVLGFMKSTKDPRNCVAAATVMMIQKQGEKYEVLKIVEDRDAVVLPASTSAVHDVEGQRLFLAGIFSPFMAVCEKRS